MKKFLLCLFSVFCLFSLVGCKKDPEPTPDPDPDPEPVVTEYDKIIKEYLDETIPTDVKANIELPHSYSFDDDVYARIEWETSNERTISKKGRFSKNLFDEEIVLTGTVQYDNGEEDYKYTKTVKTEGKENLAEYKKTIEDNLPDYVYRDFDVITHDLTFKKYNLFGEITYTTSDTEVLKVTEVTEEVDGKQETKTVIKYVNTDPTDQKVDLNYVCKINGIEVKGTKQVTVEARQDEKYLNAAKEYLDKLFVNTLVYSQVELPETDDKGRVGITWRSSNPVIIGHDGTLYVFEPNKKVTLTATINYNGTVETWEKEFHTFADGELLDFIVNRIHRPEVQQYIMHVYAYNARNYGFIPFYYRDIEMKDVVTDTTANNTKINYVKNSTHNANTDTLKVETGLVPWNNMGRPQIMKTGTYLITVHDTGDANHSASWWNDLEKTNDQRETSWNFTVGEDVIYQHIPINEVAWHAGDGSNRFSLKDTGVKFDGYNPEITLGVDHYLHINGKRSNIATPKTYSGYEANDISGAGLYTCLGENGNYWMADVYASTYSAASRRYYVCTRGGNRNSVGIETDIHKGVDYNKVMRNCANLVGNLLVHFNLDPSRVMQHRNFSGKLCPQVMIENNTWDYFLHMVQNEYIIKKYIPNIKLEYTSNNPDLLDNTGKILKEVTTDTKVSYTVKATLGTETKTFEFETIIKPI